MADADRACAGVIGERLEDWGTQNLRDFAWRSWSDPYRVTVVEVLLQQTAAQKVAAFVDDWFKAYPDWQALAAATSEELESYLRPLGLHRRRAAVLGRLARSFLGDPRAELASRPGVGQYISRAVSVALHGGREAMVDVNFVRILRRAFEGPWMADYRYDRRLQDLAQGVVDGARDPRRVNWAVLDLAAKVCRPRRPNCWECPIIQECASGREAGGVPRGEGTA